MHFKRKLGLAVALALAGVTGATGATLIGISSSNPGRLYGLDPLTGLATSLGSVGFTTTNSDIDFLNGTLYTTDVWTTNWMFGTLNSTTGAYTAPVVSQGGS